MLIRWGIISILLLPLTAAAELEQAPIVLELNAYLEQVRTGNPGVAAAYAGVDAARLSALDRDLLTSPVAFAQVTRQKEYFSPQLDPTTDGTSRSQNLYVVGLDSRTDFGLSARLAHQTSFAMIAGADLLFLPLDNFHTSRTSLELRQDLWRNSFGREVGAAGMAIKAKARADEQERLYQARQLLARAEITYWQLGLARAVVRLQRELLERAQKIEAWAQDRARLKLIDQGDWLQAGAGVQLRLLELAAAQDREKAAAREFNLWRGVPEGDVAEEPTTPDSKGILLSDLPEDEPRRLDVQAREQAAAAAAMQATVQGESLNPEVQASLAMSLNGLDKEFSKSFSDAWTTRYYAYAVGVDMRVPLDWGTRQARQRGYEQDAAAAAKVAEQLRQEADSEWEELHRRLRETSERLAIAQKLEAMQKQKADYERGRLRTGNTVTFQVLQFEQDWGQSRLARLGVEGELLALLAQVKAFEEGSTR